METELLNSTQNRRVSSGDCSFGATIFSISTKVLLASLIFLSACRVPDPPILKKQNTGLVYDTAMESQIGSGKAPAIVQTAYERYVDTLSEPVAITGWDETTCRWEVFVATNRDRFGVAGDGDENRALKTVCYGRSQVILPRLRRGEDPRLTPPKKTRGIPSAGSRSTEPLVTRIESHALDEERFLDGVNDQLQRSRQQDLLVFVHGFNVTFDAAVARTAQIALDIPFNGAVISYCWPSQGGVLNYDDDEPINKESVGPFTDFLKTLRSGIPPETRINIVVHSMGNRIVMESLDQLSRERQKASKKPFANIALCAPDVGRTDFQAWAPGVVLVADRVTLYASSGDAALIASKGLHAEPRAGDAWFDLTAEGVETVDCSRIDFSFMGHSYYGSNTDVLSDLFMLLKENLPASRRPHLSRVKSEAGNVFEFSASAPAMYWTWHFPAD